MKRTDKRVSERHRAEKKKRSEFCEAEDEEKVANAKAGGCQERITERSRGEVRVVGVVLDSSCTICCSSVRGKKGLPGPDQDTHSSV